ncbi:MAG: HAMP domain-containing histidine kinase [Bacteroidales bacterium]|nr:HAMP domain-containing histidine kinase [Bacteroidales bacterium]
MTKISRKFSLSGIKESRKISWLYSGITITLMMIAGGVFYLLSSSYIENLYYKYISEKAHAVAIERFEKDEMDPAKYRNVVLHRQNSIPTSHELFVNMENPDSAHATLSEYLNAEQISDVEDGHEIHFRRAEEVGTAFIYYDNEGTYTVVVLSRNPYGEEISKVIGWALLILVILSAIVLYLISRLYAMKVVDRIDRNYKKEKLFVNNASHEINNPLTAIQGECDIALMRDRTPEEYRSFLYKISLETTRVIDIMHSLLQLSHTSSETIDQEMFECVDVGELIEHFASDEVLVNIEEDFQLMTQESLLTIALQNLINNAVKYSSGKPIHITVCRGKVEIKDYGIGISPDDLPHVFEPFYRASNAMNASGHGIGLALSKEIISKLGGKLSVSSKVDEGTCFEVIF